MRSNTFSVKYPRRVIFRFLTRLLGKLLLLTLGKPVVNGLDHLPQKGPMILAGNHVGVMEVVMMAVIAPKQVEFIGTGDIPLDPNYAWLGKLYGLIPVRRGSLDRKGLKDALGILQQNGILGIFPEGGIWQPDAMQAQLGVAWLSHQSETDVYPIGFCDMKGAFKKALLFKRPRLEMNIGQPIRPTLFKGDEKPYKDHLQDHANLILQKIRHLSKLDLDSEEENSKPGSYNLSIKLIDDQSNTIDIPEDYKIHQPNVLALFLRQPVVLDALSRNLKLPVIALQNIQEVSDPVSIQNSCRSVLDYLEVNTGFLTYRFGMEDGLAMKESINDLLVLAQKAVRMNCSISIEITSQG